MTKKKIRQLADFFYSSDDSDAVPLRLAYVTGRYTGFDLDRGGFIQLFEILCNSHDLQKDLKLFIEEIHEDK